MVRPVTVDGKAIDDEVLWGVLGFFTMYMLAFLFTTVLLCALPHDPVPYEQHARFPEAAASPHGIDLTTATTASLSALNSIGPGLGRVGPVENFAFVHPFGKIALSFCVLLGRLEIYSLLILFLPSFWSRRA